MKTEIRNLGKIEYAVTNQKLTLDIKVKFKSHVIVCEINLGVLLQTEINCVKLKKSLFHKVQLFFVAHTEGFLISVNTN